MYRIVNKINADNIFHVSRHLSEGNLDEARLALGFSDITVDDVYRLLYKQCHERHYKFFELYGADEEIKGIGGVRKLDGNLFLVITNDCARVDFVSWLRDAKKILEQLSKYTDKVLYCYSDSRNELAHKWFEYAGLMRKPNGVIYMPLDGQRLPLWRYERSDRTEDKDDKLSVAES